MIDGYDYSEKYFYIRDKQYKPVMAVAYLETEHFVDIGFSVCHKNDECNKKAGKSLAKERLSDNTVKRRIFKRGKESSKQAILYHLLQWDLVPDRCKEDAACRLQNTIAKNYLGKRVALFY